MYLSKNSVISLFFQMHFLYSGKDIRKQGGTQFFSVLRYFLALDEFISAEKRNCDTTDKDDKQKFIKNVGHVVQLTDSDKKESRDTKNFFNSFGNNDDFDTGSNFFSTIVKGSENSREAKPYPKKNPLILCKKCQISLAKNAHKTFAQYLTNDEDSFAILFLWLNRLTGVSDRSSAYNDFLKHLKESYSPELVKALKWDSEKIKKKINEYINLLDFEKNAAFLNRTDVIFNGLDENQIKKVFSVYLVANCPTQKYSLKSRYIEICESILDKKIKGDDIGNVFRYRNSEEYKNDYKQMKKINGGALNDEDMEALDLYQEFLDSMPSNSSHWQYLLEKNAKQKNLLTSIDSTGYRVVVQNGFIIAVCDNNLFTCFKNEKFDLYREQIKQKIESEKKWLLCTALEPFPDKPYEKAKMMDIIESDDDKCLYFETRDSTEFEAVFDELVGLLTKSKGQSFLPKKQVVYYGVPGSGKSHTINEKLKNVADYNKIRTVFHPEYTNADFIGQILPEVNVDANGHSVVEYKFNPGPFTEIVRRAYLNPDEEFFLVIEEINRGNAAAIFGDMFQLLDRLDADEKPEEVSSEHIYGAGWSSYGVDNPDINAYIRNQFFTQERPEHCLKANGLGEGANPRLYKSVDIESDNLKVTWKEKNGNVFTPKLKHLHFSANTAIRLPPNLSIYATMNTSDQNVFTLDNAFQRRWDMELVPNTCNWDDEDHKKQAQSPIGDTDICWETFRDAVNSKISDGDFFNADDKQLGLFFIEADGEKIDEKKFANKVLKYLWADVFKRDTGKIFKSENLSNVVQDFTGTDAFDKVFTDEFAQSLKDTNDAIKNR